MENTLPSTLKMACPVTASLTLKSSPPIDSFFSRTLSAIWVWCCVKAGIAPIGIGEGASMGGGCGGCFMELKRPIVDVLLVLDADNDTRYDERENVNLAWILYKTDRLGEQLLAQYILHQPMLVEIHHPMTHWPCRHRPWAVRDRRRAAWRGVICVGPRPPERPAYGAPCSRAPVNDLHLLLHRHDLNLQSMQTQEKTNTV